MPDSSPPGFRWITTEDGNHVMIDSDGRIVSGLGGNFNGQAIGEAFGKPSEPNTAATSNGLSSYYYNDGRSSIPTISSEQTLSERQSKIDSVHIDFEKDNVLPDLNKEDLEELGKENKPVLLKKSVIERNFQKHPEVDKEDYNRIVGQALYDSDERFSGKPYHNPDYVNFVKYGDKYAALTLVEFAETKDNYEIVHIFEPKNKKAKKMNPK